MIIAISIMISVIFIGYNIINGITKTTKNQSITTGFQQSANLLNKYLSKDLEKSKEVKITDNGKSSYSYNIKMYDNTVIKYVTYKDGLNYTVERQEDGAKFEIINKQPILNKERPFSIDLDKENNLYKVCVYIEKNDIYRFYVSPKISNPIVIEDIANTDIIIETDDDIYEANISVGNEIFKIDKFLDKEYKPVKIIINFEKEEIKIIDMLNNQKSWTLNPDIFKSKFKEKYTKASEIKISSKGDFIIKYPTVYVEGYDDIDIKDLTNSKDNNDGCIIKIKEGKEIKHISFNMDIQGMTKILFK